MNFEQDSIFLLGIIIFVVSVQLINKTLKEGKKALEDLKK